jgi:hypothetical protein
MRQFIHEPRDACKCSYCGIKEDVRLLDGVLDMNGNDTGKLGCIKCYPTEGWCCGAPEMIEMSIAPSLRPFYDQYAASEQWNMRR